VAAPTKQPAKEECEDWLTTYADAITLLMAFFVMLLSFAKFNIPDFEEAAAAIKEKIGGREETSPTTALKIDVQDVVFQMQADQVVNVAVDDRGVVIELASSAFYKPGSADFREEAIPVLQKMGQLLGAPRYDLYLVEVEGHTDDIPIKSERFPSNWELSAGRASRVVRYFTGETDERHRIDPRRTRAVGLADTRPKVPHRDAAGKPIPENQAANRRVNIRVYPMSIEERKQFQARIKVEGSGGEAPRRETPAPAQPAPAPTSQAPAASPPAAAASPPGAAAQAQPPAPPPQVRAQR
jgi:chemotaxis protein MotB